MSGIGLRIIFAAFLSIAGCFVTYTITTRNRTEVLNSKTDNPVAVLIASENEVQRRASGRLVWRRAFDNQILFAGEAVRTELDSTATIEFLAKKSQIQLDPETVVEIVEDSEGINLDFLKGNLFIKTADPGLRITLRSGGRKIAVQDADVSISKSSADGELQVEVNRGSIKELEKEPARIEILSPVPRQTSYLEPDKNHSVKIEWRQIDPSYKVSAEVGSSPQRLKTVNEAAAGSSNLQLDLPNGRHYFKLTAVDPSGKLPTITSFTRKIDLRSKFPPITLEPAKSAEVRVTPGNQKVEFRWANPGRLENLVFEYARSADLRVDNSLVRTKNGLSATVDMRWSSGDIFWRVSGTVPDTKDVVTSKIAKFTLVDANLVPMKVATVAVATPVPTPTPIAVATPTEKVALATPSPTPAATPNRETASIPKQKISPPSIEETLQKEGITGKTDGTADVNWKPVSKAKQYQVKVIDSQGKVVQTTRVNGTSTTLTNLKTGEYKVSLSSIDQAGEIGTASKDISLKIPEYSSVRAPKIKSMNIK
jgi:hypothetical protein